MDVDYIGTKKGKHGEVGLDPEDWDEFRVLGHRMLDEMLTNLQNIGDRKTNFPTEEAIRNIRSPLKPEGEGEEATYEVFKRDILPYTFPHIGPRFLGVVAGTGSPYGMLAEMLAGGVNSCLETMFSEGYMHEQVIEWVKELLGYPKEAGGVLVGGGSEANFTGLAVARNSKARVDAKQKGIQALDKRMTLYVSEEGHHCLERSVELLGLGNEALRWVPTGDEYRIRIDALKRAIKEDRARNYHPFSIIGCAGTINTGAFDDLRALADVAAREDMWLHVEGAFGAWVKLSETHKHLVDGIERADSVAVDLHKWMSMPYGVGCTLVRNRLAHFSTFVYGHEAKYLKSGFAGVEDQLTNPHNLALPLSRNLSLKTYLLFRATGRDKFSRVIQQNLDQTRQLAELIRGEPELEITAPTTSNIVCFRYKPAGLVEEELEKLNRAILKEIYSISFWMISDATLKGRYSLRACNINHRTRAEDLSYIVGEVVKIGRRLSSV